MKLPGTLLSPKLRLGGPENNKAKGNPAVSEKKVAQGAKDANRKKRRKGAH